MRIFCFSLSVLIKNTSHSGGDGRETVLCCKLVQKTKSTRHAGLCCTGGMWQHRCDKLTTGCILPCCCSGPHFAFPFITVQPHSGVLSLLLFRVDCCVAKKLQLAGECLCAALVWTQHSTTPQGTTSHSTSSGTHWDTAR